MRFLNKKHKATNILFDDEKTYCEKCKSTQNLIYNTWPTMKTYCDKCWKVSLDGMFPLITNKLEKQTFYLWYDSIEENGIEWYKKARDKIINQLDKRKVKDNKLEELRNKRLKDSIDNLN